MPRSNIDFDVVREIGLALPDVEDGTSYGGPSLKIRGRLFTCPAIHKSAEPNSLVVRIGFGERDRLLAEAPDTYYLTDHYLKHPAVLVRFAKINRKSLRELLHASWRFVMEKV